MTGHFMRSQRAAVLFGSGSSINKGLSFQPASTPLGEIRAYKRFSNQPSLPSSNLFVQHHPYPISVWEAGCQKDAPTSPPDIPSWALHRQHVAPSSQGHPAMTHQPKCKTTISAPSLSLSLALLLCLTYSTSLSVDTFSKEQKTILYSTFYPQSVFHLTLYTQGLILMLTWLIS